MICSNYGPFMNICFAKLLTLTSVLYIIWKFQYKFLFFALLSLDTKLTKVYLLIEKLLISCYLVVTYFFNYFKIKTFKGFLIVLCYWLAPYSNVYQLFYIVLYFILAITYWPACRVPPPPNSLKLTRTNLRVVMLPRASSICLSMFHHQLCRHGFYYS